MKENSTDKYLKIQQKRTLTRGIEHIVCCTYTMYAHTYMCMYTYSEEQTQEINVMVKMRDRQIDKRMRFLVILNVG